MLGFFLDAYHAIAANLSDTKPLRVRNFLQEYLGAFSLLLEIGDRLAYVIFNDVVAQNYTNGVPVCEMLGQCQSVRDSTLSILVCVIQVL